MRILASSEQVGTEKMKKKLSKWTFWPRQSLDGSLLLSANDRVTRVFFPPKIWFGNVPLLSKEIICTVFVLRNKRMFPTDMSTEMEVDGPRGAFT